MIQLLQIIVLVLSQADLCVDTVGQILRSRQKDGAMSLLDLELDTGKGSRKKNFRIFRRGSCSGSCSGNPLRIRDPSGFSKRGPGKKDPCECGSYSCATPEVLESASRARKPGSVTVNGEFLGTTRNPVANTPEGYRAHSTCYSNVGYGPLALHSHSPFNSMRLGIVPRPPSNLAGNHFELRATATSVNIWAYKQQKYHLDYEMLQSTVSVAYGLTDTLQVDIEFEDRSRFGGILDGLIQGSHDLMGLSQSGREQFPKGDFVFDVDGVSLSNGDRGHFRQSLSISVQHNLTCGTDTVPAFACALTARFKVNDAGDIQSDGLVDLGASISIARRFGDFYIYFIFGYAYFGEERFHGINLEVDQFSGITAVEWRYAPTQSFILQYLYTEGVARDLSPFSRSSNEVTLGWKGEILKNVVLELGLIENIITYDNSPDFGIHAGLTMRF